MLQIIQKQEVRWNFYSKINVLLCKNREGDYIYETASDLYTVNTVFVLGVLSEHGKAYADRNNSAVCC